MKAKAMGATSLTFYAAGNELRPWIGTLFAETPDLWVLLEERSGRLPVSFQASDVPSLRFEGRDYAWRLFVGRRSLSSPKWRVVSGARVFDFVAAQAVQLVPSLVDGDAMLEGQLAIMPADDYRAAPVSAESLDSWFKSLARSLRKRLGLRRVFLLEAKPGEKRVPSRARAFVSSGALQWTRVGGRLKQFSDATLEFFPVLSE